MLRSIQQATCIPNLKNLSSFMRPWLQKMGLTYFWLQTRSKWPNCDATQTRHVVPPTECLYQASNWYLKACWRKVRKTRTDGQTDRHCHGIIRPFFKRAYKNTLAVIDQEHHARVRIHDYSRAVKLPWIFPGAHWLSMKLLEIFRWPCCCIELEKGMSPWWLPVPISGLINSLAPGKFEWYLRNLIFQIISEIDGWGVSCELALRWMPLDLIDDKSKLVQVMAWCRQATSHYQSQCWPRSMSPYHDMVSLGHNELFHHNKGCLVIPSCNLPAKFSAISRAFSSIIAISSSTVYDVSLMET